MRLNTILKHLKSHLPLRMPVGKTAFDAWLSEIVDLVGPIADAESIAWVACNEIMRLPPGSDRIPQQKLIRIVRKFAANQLAANKVNELKAAQEERKAAQIAAAQPTEATPEASDGTTQTTN